MKISLPKNFFALFGTKRKQYTREIFTNGRYAASFRPDSSRNPFQHIYDQKRREVVEYIEQNNDLRKILDIGSGMARISSAVTASNERSVFCADISFDMLKMGRTRCQTKEYNDKYCWCGKARRYGFSTRNGRSENRTNRER